jgi:hypothetical protein
LLAANHGEVRADARLQSSNQKAYVLGNITDEIAQIKSDEARAIEASLITRLFVEVGHR